jgi:3-dehydroquinate synthase
MKSKLVNIELNTCQYDIIINLNRFDFDQIKALLSNRKIAIISNDTVAPLYLETLKETIFKYNNSVISLNLPDGEIYKNQQSLNMIFDFLAANNFNRSDLLISLGGGGICDMTGFAAASWMRGIDFIQVPTSLLAQVDASVGGKTGINHEKGKNLIGAFHQPKAVIINTATLKTLPTKEFKSGMGEVLKYGIINQPIFLDWLSENSAQINTINLSIMSKLIAKCCSFKAEIVQQDEKESGIRALLNLGHTFAHAIETFSHYKTYSHGEAVSIGMVMAAELSEILGLSEKYLRKELEKHLQQFHLQIKLINKIKPLELVRLMRLDKKVVANKHRLILMKSLGGALIQTDICEENILQAIINCQH